MGCCPKGPPRVPSMNLTANVWHNGGVTPPVGLPNITGVVCALVQGDRVHINAQPVMVNTPVIHAYILFPKLTDIRDQYSGPGNPSIVECPAGSGRWYVVNHVDDVGKGYANEYREVLVAKAGGWPTPVP